METAPVAAEPVAPSPPPEPAPVEEAPKKGPLARLADGVSDLFARVTGKKAPEPDQTMPDQTMEIAADDLIDASTPPPIPPPTERVGELFARVKGSPLPPDKTMEISMEDLLAADSATPPPISGAAPTSSAP